MQALAEEQVLVSVRAAQVEPFRFGEYRGVAAGGAEPEEQPRLIGELDTAEPGGPRGDSPARRAPACRWRRRSLPVPPPRS